MNMDLYCDESEHGDVTIGTTARKAYELYLSARRKIEDLEYQCGLLVDNYHSEMQRANIPGWLRACRLDAMFSDDATARDAARREFLECCFSRDFRASHDVKPVELRYMGYSHTSAEVCLEIGEYLYNVEVPLPENIRSPKDKARLMGRVMFRADKLPRSEAASFCKKWAPVQPPTYGWKACFSAIEEDCRRGLPESGAGGPRIERSTRHSRRTEEVEN